MGRWNTKRYTLASCAATALLAGCGGAQPPIGAPGTMPRSRSVATHADRGGSWMLPEAGGQDLVYVSDMGNSSRPSSVYVYSYPSGKLVGVLTGFGSALDECTDEIGDVFIADSSGANMGVYEYAHGGSQPTEFLPLYYAIACSVDPKSGNLAVIQNNGGSVYVYSDAQGTPKVYTNSDIYYLGGVSYDGSGNLFVIGSYKGNADTRVGHNVSPGVAFLELPNGGTAFEPITLNGAFSDADQEPMQWDGKHLGLGTIEGYHCKGCTVVNRVKINNRSATIVGRVPLARQSHGEHTEFWIQGGLALQGGVPSQARSEPYFESFKYPRGKEVEKVKLPNGAYSAWGITLSIAPSHR